MPFSRVQVTGFDAKDSVMWFMADLIGFVQLWGATAAISLLAVGLLFQVGIDLTHPIGFGYALLAHYFSAEWALAVCAMLLGTPAFVLIYIMRRNVFVVGPQRQFSYGSRFVAWLKAN